MPRTLNEILADAYNGPDDSDELAEHFENHEPDSDRIHDATPLRDLRQRFEDAAAAQKRLADAVAVARGYGHSWAAIGTMVGTSGEAARQRYGTKHGTGSVVTIGFAEGACDVDMTGSPLLVIQPHTHDHEPADPIQGT